MDICTHIINIHPSLDKMDKFMFFSNHKAAQTSINRHLLKDRVVLIKGSSSEKRAYVNKLCSYIDCSFKLPHRNKTKHTHYRDYYDKKSMQIVADVYKEDVELFNYKF